MPHDPCGRIRLSKDSFTAISNHTGSSAVWLFHPHHMVRLPCGSAGKEPCCQCKRCKRRGFHPCVRRIPWRMKWPLAPVLLPGKPHGQRSLAGSCPWGHKESDTPECACTRQVVNSGTFPLHLVWPAFLNYIRRRWCTWCCMLSEAQERKSCSSRLSLLESSFLPLGMYPLRTPLAALRNLSPMKGGGDIRVNSLSWAHIHVIPAQESVMPQKKLPDDTGPNSPETPNAPRCFSLQPRFQTLCSRDKPTTDPFLNSWLTESIFVRYC